MVGYTFRGDWAEQHDGLVGRFNNAIRNARELLRDDDEAWNRLRPMMRVENEATFIALRDRYREGIPLQWGETDRKSAVQLMAILSEIGGREAVGSSTQLMPGTFLVGRIFLKIFDAPTGITAFILFYFIYLFI